MSVPRWIHCNICLHLLSRKERKFYHLSCRHVLCRQCMGKTSRGTICPVCNKPLERFTELSNQMDRKEKMLYDSGSLKLLSVAYQSVIFQHKQRENMIRGILRCRKAIMQMKDMEDSLRQKIVETQRRYEKFRTYRRNLQETLRQMSPRYGNGPLMGTNGRAAVPQITDYPSALPNRDGDPDSRRYDRRRPTSTVPSLTNRPLHNATFDTSSLTNRPSSVMDSSFTRQHVTMIHAQRSNTDHFREVGGKIGGTNMNAFANDSGISGMQTPSSNFSFGGSSRIAEHRHQQHTPSTPARYHTGGASYLHDQMLSSSKPRY
ncbi:RING finger protein narya-like [Anopheles marshallii]|uniref:RING finger protein narya-like n=1 Tax=Anopheles marshallii TaxID=1521116 RepID=UPI00237C152D|nr:RING finger protein narya-like [Anopheles marshallii]